ncbi:MAG TPA: ABC transporter permease [Gemmatimonadales bacterium]|nr:ABC transporter permease [Gemmatimonadales bacterium]
MIDAVASDLRYAFRGMRQRPGFAAVAVLTLALGIGATTAIFSVVNGVLLRPLPYQRPEQLVMIWGWREQKAQAELSVPEYCEMREQAHSFQGVAAFAGGSVNLTGSGTPERLQMGYVTAEALPLLGVAPAIGRGLTTDDDLPGHSPVVLLSDGVWRRRFGADRSVIGRTVILDDATTTIVGVMPPGFQLPLHFAGSEMELWGPLQLDPATDRSVRGWHFLQMIGRLRPGVDAAAAEREVAGLAHRMRDAYPNDYLPGFTASVRPVDDQVVGAARPAILLLLGAVGLLLLIACANVASLLLARAESRQREMALRSALGAGRGRIVRQLITESVALATIGGLVGLLLAAWGVRGLILAAPSSVPRLGAIEVDGWVLTFAAAASLSAALLFGLVPVLHAGRVDLATTLAEGGRWGSSGAAGQRFRRGLVVGQIALALVLLIGAGLLVQSFLRVRGVDPGFDPEHLLTARIELTSVRYPHSPEIRALYDNLLRRVRAIPGVTSAAAVRALPMTGQTDIGDWSFVIEGAFSTPPAPGDWHPADWEVVTPDYFRTMRIPVLQGRGVEPEDRLDAPGAVVINQTLARKVWPGGNALGQRVLLGGGAVDSVWRTVVGIVGDVRRRGLSDEPRPEMFLPHAQFPAGTGTAARSLYLAVRASGSPARLAPALRAALDEVDPNIPLSEVQTMEQALGSWTAERRLTMLLVTGFALVALTLGAVGIYGVMAHQVVRRSREIGIRMALGAVPREILLLVLSQGGWLASVGIAAGLAGALVATRLIEALLFQVRPTDPMTFLATALVLAVVTVLASLVPAVRATRVNPIETLRSD